MKRRISLLLVLLIALLAVFSLAGPAGASRSAEPLVPPPGTWPVVGYQGQVTVAGTPFNGTGYFKFAILDYFGEGFYWSNAPMSGDQPDAAVSLTVSNGLFNVLLGDTTITNMAALSATPFRDSVCVLRVWFSSDGSTFTLLSPDRRIAAVPNALGAELANDANTLDGSHATAFASSTHTHQTLTAGTGLSGGTYNGGTPVTLNVGSGNGITSNADNLDLGPLAANWNQTGPFDVVLGNAASELQIMESTGNTYYGILDVGDLGAHQTYNFTTGGTVWTAGNDGAGSGLDADLLDNQHASAFVGAGQANSVTSAMIVNGTVALADIGQNGCANGQVMQWNGTGWACANMAGVTDHGALTGLLDDDHPQYLNLAQNETVTGIPAFNGGISGTSAPFSVSSNTLVTNLNADLLDGQHGGAYYVQGGNSFGAVGTLGTNDNYALELEVNNARALRIEPGPDIPNLIGGYSGNRVTAGIRGATIGGGGFSGMANSVTDDYGTVSGGLENQAGNNAGSTFDADNATVGGGRTNTASGFYATIGGGGWNTASASYATIAGGGANTASGWTATVPGGSSNTAQGDYSFAAGRRAKANAAGCFTWGDSTDADFTCSTTNQFAVRATGGVNFQTATAAVQVNGNTVWHAGNDGAGSGLDADLLDGQHTGNGSGNVPLSNGTVNSSLNADLLDGQHAGNGSGNVPLSNGTVNINLNADLLDGRHVGNASLNVPLSNGTVSTNLNADLLDGQHAGNGSGNVPLSNGTINTNLNADLLDGRQATGFWQTGGNAGTDPATNYLGTSDAVALKLGTNGAGAAWITPAGDVGIGTASPTERLTVSGDALVTGDLTVQANVFGHVLVTTLTGTTTLSASQAGVVLVNNAANCTITLPAASSATGVTFTVKRLSTNQVTVTAASGNIDGNTSENLLSKWAYLTVVSNGTDWFIVARGS